MRSILVLILVFFIHTESHSQLLPATVKKPSIKKPTPPKKTTKPITVEASKDPIAVPQVKTEIKNEVKPLPVEEEKSTLKIIADDDALIYVDGEKVGSSMKEVAYKLTLSKGVYNIKLVSSKLPVFESKVEYRVDANGIDDIWNVSLRKKEIDYWVSELINTINPYLSSIFYETRKLKGKTSIVTKKHSIGIVDNVVYSKFTTTSLNARGLEETDAINLKEINIKEIIGYELKSIKDAVNGSSLLLMLDGNATTEFIYMNPKIPNFKTNDVFYIKINSEKQSELEPKLVELFKVKPF